MMHEVAWFKDCADVPVVLNRRHDPLSFGVRIRSCRRVIRRIGIEPTWVVFVPGCRHCRLSLQSFLVATGASLRRREKEPYTCNRAIPSLQPSSAKWSLGMLMLMLMRVSDSPTRIASVTRRAEKSVRFTPQHIKLEMLVQSEEVVRS